MIRGCNLTRLALPRARVFTREPYGLLIVSNGGQTLEGTFAPLRGIKRGKPFEGDVEIMPPAAVGGWVVGEFQLWESDDDHRRLGDRIQRYLQQLKGSFVVAPSVVYSVAPALGASLAMVKRGAGFLAGFLSNDRDDFIASVDFEFHVDDLTVGKVLKFGTQRVALDFRITGPDLDRADSDDPLE